MHVPLDDFIRYLTGGDFAEGQRTEPLRGLVVRVGTFATGMTIR